MADAVNLDQSAADLMIGFHGLTKLNPRSIDAFRARANKFNTLPPNSHLSLRGEGVERYLAHMENSEAEPKPPMTNPLIVDLLNGRRSSRRYSDPDECPDTNARLLAVLTDALSIKTREWTRERPEGARSYSSAGGLYPVDHYVLLRSDENQYCLGQYLPFLGRVDLDTTCLYPVGRISRVTSIQQEVLEHCTLVVIQTARLSISVEKYGARAYRFLLIEAGMAAQSVALTAEAYGLGTCLWGGFLDDELAQLVFNDRTPALPLNVMTLGLPADTESQVQW